MNDLEYLKTNFLRVVNPFNRKVYDFKKRKQVRKNGGSFPMSGYLCLECGWADNMTSHYLIGKNIMCELCALERIKLIRNHTVSSDIISYHTKRQNGNPCSAHDDCGMCYGRPCEVCGRIDMKSIQRPKTTREKDLDKLRAKVKKKRFREKIKTFFRGLFRR